MSGIVTRRRATPGLGAFVLGLALATGGCADKDSNSVSSDDLFDSYDADSDGMLNQDEWLQLHIDLDANGDGAVSRDEFHVGLGGGGR